MREDDSLTAMTAMLQLFFALPAEMQSYVLAYGDPTVNLKHTCVMAQCQFHAREFDYQRAVHITSPYFGWSEHLFSKFALCKTRQKSDVRRQSTPA